MERARLVAAIWDWLPAFRAIAETEHLPTAAKRMGVTPPALSRTLRLLEDAVGKPLFNRVGRRLELAPEGQLLLHGVRDAMRRVHDAVEHVAGSPSIGPVHIASIGVLQPYVARAVVALVQAHARSTPEVHDLGATDVSDALLDGRIDVAIRSAPLARDGIELVALGEVGRGVYCGVGHPLFEVTTPDLGPHGFVAPPPGPEGEVDGWPPATPREVPIRVADPAVAAQICATGSALAVLTDALARSHGLWRVADAEPCPIFAARRSRLTDAPDRTDLFIDALVGEVQADQGQL